MVPTKGWAFFLSLGSKGKRIPKKAGVIFLYPYKREN